ncbi:hypothetical protein F2Q70_00036815 [Brassica cretica]|uniref:Uncharacterized protein n=2 Tax=Brassica TaxID=3705 RepID=A0A8S9GF56_BRACR|nr:hypothetical protein F2Q68_00032139 [Brassica cretica]KAF2585358.1 hypothetical protein F2Q70_00036815 [Brassica cretica]
MEFQGSENVVDNIKLRRARHQTLRHSAAADDPPLTHAVPPISQPNRFSMTHDKEVFSLRSDNSRSHGAEDVLIAFVEKGQLHMDFSSMLL